MLGPKIDARLNALERKLTDLTHRLERLEQPKVSPNDTKDTESAAKPEVSSEQVIPKRRGRPPKAKNG